MRKLRLSAEGLIAAVILNALVFYLASDRVAWTPTIAGICILVVLVVFDKGQARSFGQSVAYAASCGFLLATAAVFPMVRYLHEFTAPIDTLTGKPLLPALWLVGAVAFLTADRVRNNTTPTTVQLRSLEAVVSVPPPAASVEAAVVLDSRVVEPPPPAAIPKDAVEVKAQPAPKGKPAVIYVNLLGSGIACLRPIQAERLSRDFYRIVEPVPEGEEWEFQTGQIVRCRKQSLSSGKGLVAFEEAPRVS